MADMGAPASNCGTLTSQLPEVLQLLAICTRGRQRTVKGSDCVDRAAMAESGNTLLSTKPSDSRLSVLIHPLVLLTISDFVTRRQLRKQKGPIVGALLGQQKGHEISLEYAFESNVQTSQSGDVTLQRPWFDERLKQCELSSEKTSFHCPY